MILQFFRTKKALLNVIANQDELIVEIEKQRRNLYNFNFDQKYKHNSIQEFTGPIQSLKGCKSIFALKPLKKFQKEMYEVITYDASSNQARYHYFDKSIQFIEADIEGDTEREEKKDGKITKE